jgi:hypothetical protein
VKDVVKSVTTLKPDGALPLFSHRQLRRTESLQPENHYTDQLMLRRLFGALVERTFLQTLGVHEPGVTDYLADVLTDFAHFKQVYKVKDLQGRPLTEVADMLLEADVRLNATSFNREREVHKHIGDFTLFWAGVYPESLGQMQAQARKDHLLDYVKQGKNSYAIAASFDYGDYRPQAPVLKKLSEEFELCLYGLHIVRKEMDGLKHAA